MSACLIGGGGVTGMRNPVRPLLMSPICFRLIRLFLRLGAGQQITGREERRPRRFAHREQPPVARKSRETTR